MPTVGGFSDVKPADEAVSELFSSAEALAQVSQLLGSPVTTLAVHGYRSQVVAGVNYRVHAVVNGVSHVVLTAHKPLPHTGLPLHVTAAVPGQDL